MISGLSGYMVDALRWKDYGFKYEEVVFEGSIMLFAVGRDCLPCLLSFPNLFKRLTPVAEIAEAALINYLCKKVVGQMLAVFERHRVADGIFFMIELRHIAHCDRMGWCA